MGSEPEQSIDSDLSGIQASQHGIERRVAWERHLSGYQVLGESTKSLGQHHRVFDHFDQQSLGALVPFGSVFLLDTLHHIHPPGFTG